MRIVGDVADLVDREKGRSQEAAEAPLERAGGFLASEIEDEIGRGEESLRSASGSGPIATHGFD